MEAVRLRRLLRADIVMDLDGDADLLEMQSREVIVAEELVVEVGELAWLVSMNQSKGAQAHTFTQNTSVMAMNLGRCSDSTCFARLMLVL